MENRLDSASLQPAAKKFNKILMIQIPFFATIPVEPTKGPLKKSLITRMYTIDRAGGGMDADDLRKAPVTAR